jgi:hypothetical protein
VLGFFFWGYYVFMYCSGSAFLFLGSSSSSSP